MYAKYGTYRHELGEHTFTVLREAIPSPAGDTWAIRETWNINGVLTNTSGNPNTLDTKVAALIAAYGQDNQDLAIILPDGTRSQSHRLLNSDTIGGVRVVRPPSFPKGEGAEGVTYRTFTVTLEAIKPTVATHLVLSFEETVSWSGGGPEFGYLYPAIGAPVRQQLRRQTTYKATQSGRAVGLSRYPTVPRPIWPMARLRPEETPITKRSPRRVGGSYIEYEISWNYQFESASKLVGGVHLWTIG